MNDELALLAAIVAVSAFNVALWVGSIVYLLSALSVGHFG